MIRGRTGPGTDSVSRFSPAGPRAGFTLTETLVVLVLLGIAAAAVAPDLRALLRPGSGAVARELAEVYRDARGMAASRGSAVFVAVDPATGAWRTFVGATGSPGAAASSGNLLADRPGTLLLTAGDGSAIVAFGPHGTARGPDVRVRAGGQTLEVSVDPWTGAVRIRPRGAR